MIFTTSRFFIFLALILAAYWFGPRKLPRNPLLLAASWYFYSAGEWRFFPILLLFTSMDFVYARFIDAARQKGRSRTGLLAMSLACNVGLLAFFKLSWLLAAWFPALKQVYVTSHDQVLFPVGISFYTFQSLAYTIDVYRGRVRACRSFVDFALYVSFFPQLVAGPIERAETLLTQLRKPHDQRVPTPRMLREAGWLIFWGLIKKVAIADRLMPYTRWGVSELNLEHGADVWLASTAFILEFLCDFSAYTDIALGLALLFGIRLSENFRYPYFATGPRDFWRRWHITLGSWFRDYFHSPLVRRGVPRAAAAVATMALVGVWHGAEPKFLLWGVLWGLLLVGDEARAKLLPEARSRFARRAAAVAGWAFVMIAWIVLGFLFVAHDLQGAWTLLVRAASPSMSHRFLSDLGTAAVYLTPFFLIETLQWRKDDRFFWFQWPAPARWALVFFLTVFLVGNYAAGGKEFIYFAF